jgi:hypothetical protein
MRQATLVAALAVTTVVIAACGDDSRTLEEWASQSDELCKRGDAEQRAAVERFFEREGISQRQPPTAAQLERLATEVVVPNIQTQIDDVAALERPEAEADEVQSFLDQAQSDLDAIVGDPSLINQANPFGETTELAEGLGLEECAQ